MNVDFEYFLYFVHFQRIFFLIFEERLRKRRQESKVASFGEKCVASCQTNLLHQLLIVFCFIHPGNISSYRPGLLVRRNATACQALWVSESRCDHCLKHWFFMTVGHIPKHLPQNLYKKRCYPCCKSPFHHFDGCSVVNNTSIFVYIFNNYFFWCNSAFHNE